MLFRLLVIFTVVPLVELALLIWIAEHTSWWFTLGLVITTGVAGASLARYEGLRCLRNVQRELAEGRLPASSLVDGLLILLAGALLITPGVLTDAVGLALLVPPVRRLVRRWLKRRFQSRMFVAGPYGAEPRDPSGRRPPHDHIIDVKILDAEHRAPEDAEQDEDESP